MAITNRSSFLLCAILSVSVISCVGARIISPVLRFGSQGVQENEQCGPKLSIETPSCFVEKNADGFELRRYPAGQIWAETLIANSSFSIATTVGFFRCFYYISGKNSAEEQIEMTGPVLIKPVSEASGWKISFFTPSKFKSVADVPVPTSPDVKIVSTEETLVAVSPIIGGFLGEEEWHTNWLKFKDTLDAAKIQYDESSLVYAGYSSPFEIFNRKQEIHVTVVKL